ncbi:MAG: DUF2312 domain-containing protein [Rhodospirillales bacterium]|nr:MAG: DUF2312 domain-containing protein [Rhodospirillales bacterium]
MRAQLPQIQPGSATALRAGARDADTLGWRRVSPRTIARQLTKAGRLVSCAAHRGSWIFAEGRPWRRDRYLTHHAAQQGLSATEENVMIGRNTEAGKKLLTYAERIERLMDDIDGLKEDLKSVKVEAKNEGFNVQALSRLVSIRRTKGRADREAELLNDLVLYAYATGTPLDVAFQGDAPPADAAARAHAEREDPSDMAAEAE